MPSLVLRTATKKSFSSSLADFWQYTSSYREQPSVHFLREVIVQVGGEGGGERVWSSFPNFNQLLQQGELATPTIRVGRD